MKTYSAMKSELVDNWPSSVEPHAAADQVALHYHEVEEWLEVLDGEITFSSAGGQKHVIRKGEALNIPQGELHRVEVGPNGVQYRMWTPIPVCDETFRKELEPDELELVRRNLELPGAENRKDANPSNTAFLSDFVSSDLIFRSGGGDIVTGKDAFLKRPPSPVTRSSSGSVRVLHKGVSSLLISTTVYTTPIEGGQAKSFVNLRLFRKENSGWKCLVWMNYLESGSSHTEARRTAEQDLELWKHHATFGGEDKNRMVTIASWFLGASAAIVWFILTHPIDGNAFLFGKWGRAFVSVIGIVASIVAGYISLLYGGYANRNWEIADAIARSCGWTDLLPSGAKLPSNYGAAIKLPRKQGRLNAIAKRWAQPCDPEQKLAQVFCVYLLLAALSLVAHLAVLGWSFVSM